MLKAEKRQDTHGAVAFTSRLIANYISGSLKGIFFIHVLVAIFVCSDAIITLYQAQLSTHSEISIRTFEIEDLRSMIKVHTFSEWIEIIVFVTIAFALMSGVYKMILTKLNKGVLDSFDEMKISFKLAALVDVASILCLFLITITSGGYSNWINSLTLTMMYSILLSAIAVCGIVAYFVAWGIEYTLSDSKNKVSRDVMYH
jgi:hypothetical protein